MGGSVIPIIGTLGLRQISATPEYRLGQRVFSCDGREEFVYAKAGGTALAHGKVMQSTAPVANNVSLAVNTAAAVGATEVKVTLGGTAVTQNQYADGWLTIEKTAGYGYKYKIKSHPAQATTSGSLTLTLWEDYPLIEALTTSSEGSLIKNSYDGVIVYPTTGTSAPIGVTLVDVTASYYFWLQVKGEAMVLIDGTPGIGQTVSVSDAVAGAVEILATGTVTLPIVGQMRQIGVNTEYLLVDVKL